MYKVKKSITNREIVIKICDTSFSCTAEIIIRLQNLFI